MGTLRRCMVSRRGHSTFGTNSWGSWTSISSWDPRCFFCRSYLHFLAGMIREDVIFWWCFYGQVAWFRLGEIPSADNRERKQRKLIYIDLLFANISAKWSKCTYDMIYAWVLWFISPTVQVPGSSSEHGARVRHLECKPPYYSRGNLGI